MEAKRVFEGLTVVTVGGILLANTTGVLPWNVWLTIAALWPLLIVSLGIDILGRAVDSTALRVLSSVVVIAGLIYGALAGAGQVQAPTFFGGTRAGERFSFSEPAGTATTGRARVSAGLASVTLSAGDDLATAEGETPFGKPEFSVTPEDGRVDVDIASAGGNGTLVFPGNRRSFLDATLSRSVSWERLQVDAGLSDVKLDLSDLDVRDVVTKTDMSTTEITFGAAPPTGASATISGGMSTLRLRVPRSVGVELRTDNGLGSVNVRGGWTRTAGTGPFQGTWRTEGYDSSDSKLQLNVKAGLSSVDVERY